MAGGFWSGLVIGLALSSGWAWLRQRRHPDLKRQAGSEASSPQLLSTAQLLAWIDEATQG